MLFARVLFFFLGLLVVTGCGDDARSDAAVGDAGDAMIGDAMVDAANIDGQADTDGQANLDAARDTPFGLDERPINATCIAPERPAPSSIALRATSAYPFLAFEQAVQAIMVPGGAEWLLVELGGRVRAFADDASAGAFRDVIDLTDRVDQVGEGGLLAVALHPDYPSRAELFAFYTGEDGEFESRVSRFTSDDGGRTFDRDSEQVLLRQSQPTENHNGGFFAFGPDGFLYIGLGDGGDVPSNGSTAQDLDSLLGSILRIDVDEGTPYAVPPDNPLVGRPGRDEIWAYGFRNPWRGSFDRTSGRLFVGDVGENDIEEVDLVVRGGNYGWSHREGSRCFDGDCDRPELIDPIAEYSHAEGVSVTGGFSYQGTAIPALAGAFLYADYITGRVWATRENASDGTWSSELVLEHDSGVVSFAEDDEGELYLINMSRGLYRLMPNDSPAPSMFPDRLSATGCFDASDPTKPSEGLIPYGVQAPLYSDGAEKDRYLALPEGETITIASDGDFELPSGTVLVKTFRFGERRLETRLFMRHPDGSWAGYTYRWNDEQTDAVRVSAGALVPTPDGAWRIPTEGECMRCHSEAAGRSLGLELGQLNGPFVYPEARRSNQLATLAHIGVIELPGTIETIAKLPTYESDAPIAERARAYLHSNCSNCHRPGGPARGDLDLRHGTPLTGVNACGGRPMFGDLGIDNAELLAPGAPDRSLLLARMNTRGAGQMPPLATAIVDQQGTALIRSWIESLDRCE